MAALRARSALAQHLGQLTAPAPARCKPARAARVEATLPAGASRVERAGFRACRGATPRAQLPSHGSGRFAGDLSELGEQSRLTPEPGRGPLGLAPQRSPIVADRPARRLPVEEAREL